MIVLLACFPPHPPEKPILSPIKTHAGHYQISWTAPEPIPLSELFTIEAVVVDKEGKPVEQGALVIDARMPQHGHGMATKPEADPGQCANELCIHPGGSYKTSGMKFHMPGEWTITFAVEGPLGPDRAEVIYKL
jgi:hypothetical protein